MSGSPPTTLGKYHIIREIARSNDIVYEAYDPLMNRRVAVKELAVPGGSTPQQREDRIKRFLREARAAGSLAHPNIMTVFEVGQESDRYFIAMEFLDGKTLRNELDTKGFMSPERAIEVAKAILEGLEYAHSKGVIHRDIKPDNVQLLTSGAIKLTDFGIARLTFEPNLTMDGQVFGTPSYMSPEQVVGRDIDARSDLFSVGVVLYEMLSGSKPFLGDSVVTITYSIMNKNPDRPNQVNWALWQVVEKALDKSPQLRYRSAREFIEALDQALHASQGPVIDSKPPQQIYSPPPLISPQSIYPSSAYGVPMQPPYQGHQAQQIGPYGNQIQVPGAQPQYAQGPYSGPVSVPPSYGMPVPVYYPPPPRKPLFVVAPHVKRKIAMVFIYMTLLFAVAGLIVVGVPAILDRATQTINPSPRPARPSQTSPPTKSDRVNDLLNQGRAYENSNDYDTAERYYRQAVREDANNPDPFLNLGDLFVTRASHTPDEFMRSEYMRQAADNYAASARLQKDPDGKDHADVLAAQSWYQLALMYKDDGDPRRARDMLYNAEQHAHSNEKLEEAIQTQIDALSGSN